MSGARSPATRSGRVLVRLLVLAAIAASLAGCDRERRSQRELPPGAVAFPAVQNRSVQAGPALVLPASRGPYQENRWAVSQGQMLYMQFNCAGCHSPGGGGGMGPPLTDDEWIYGSEPEAIFETIVKGRPNGMPSYGGRIASAQVWQIVAYVRSLSGLTTRDTWPARSDHMQQTRPEREPRPRLAPLE